jgi:hypothetical protein
VPLAVGESILTGVVSGIIASVCYALFLLLIKPRVKISDQICAEDEGNSEVIYRIKIVNHTHAMLTNVKYTLCYCVMHGDGINTVTAIAPRKTPLISIDSFSRKQDNTDYAVRISYDIDKMKFPLDKMSKLEFTFIADHAMSNTTVCIKKEYTSEDIISGVFESDKSVKIIRKHQSA